IIMKKTFSLTALAFVAAMLFAAPAHAAEGVTPPKQVWPHDGITGTYDKAALQRGLQVYKEVCAACHGLNLVSYRNLADLGYNEAEIKSLAAEYTVVDGPNEDGEMFERPALPSDRFKSPFANDRAARAANGGAMPPDLSLIVKGRKHAEDYLYALLTGYKEAPETNPQTGEPVQLLPGQYWNEYFPGFALSMAPPLMDGQITYADGRSARLDEAARDVVQFLAWASEPHMEQRKQTGMKIVLFLIVFAGIMLAAKRKVWADVH
ncbi:MAG TPA: cytochrome c1, partial [Alphaproteobacteria bacterium]|nr:cytochrome c1 [Alphaproteobacteria bacterium]